MPHTLQTKNTQICHILGTFTFAVESEFGVEEGWFCPVYTDWFRLLSSTNVQDVLGWMRVTSCELDLCPSWLVKASQGRLGPLLAKVVNASLWHWHCWAGFWILKSAIVQPLLKKPLLDVNSLSSYCPVSNLPFLGKVIEWAWQLQVHVDTIGFLDTISLPLVLGLSQRLCS